MKLAYLSGFLALSVLPLIFDMRSADPISAPKLCCWLVAAALAAVVANRPWAPAHRFLALWFVWSLISCLANGLLAGWTDLLIMGAGLLWVRADVPQRDRWLALGFGATVFYSWIQRLNLDPFAWSDWELSHMRTIAGLGNPNYLAMYLACLFPWVWTRLYERGPLGWFFAGLSLLTLLMTTTRGSIFCMICMLVIATVWVLVRQRRLSRFWLLSWLFLGLAWGVSWRLTSHQTRAFADQMQALGRGNDESVSARKLLWTSAWNISRSAPLLGIGFGHFGDAYLLHRPLEPENLRKRSRRPENPHSEPLRVLAETGWVGLLLWSAFIGTALLQHRKDPGPWTACLMILLANSLSNCLPISVWPLLLLWTGREEEFRPPALRPYRLWLLPVALVVGLSGWYLERTFWWDDEWKARSQADPGRLVDYAHERIVMLGAAEPFCPPWEQIQLAIRQSGAWQNLAKLTDSKVAWEQAERGARRRVALEPENSFAWVGLAAVFEAQGRPAEALSGWQEAQKRDSINPGTLYFLARAQYSAGQPREALRSLERSLEIYSKSRQVYRFREQIMIDEGMVWEGYWDWVDSQQVLEDE
ncbi:hypothetical protein ABS71_22125 [bacterium SCN 62-11]|nr:O-antigen ligase family protein [Candidatus Eremiobacteraeota bacterium]ODT56186.1 MAG: hypothetical protein ABS71_22125 [bacterium SCN 62-11]